MSQLIGGPPDGSRVNFGDWVMESTDGDRWAVDIISPQSMLFEIDDSTACYVLCEEDDNYYHEA